MIGKTVISINGIFYTVVETVKCDIRDRNEPVSKWYAEEILYIITDGRKRGVAYDQKSRCYPAECPEYRLILDCDWDAVDVVDGANGAYMKAVDGEAPELFFLFGSYENLSFDNKLHKNRITVTVSRDVCVSEIPSGLCGSMRGLDERITTMKNSSFEYHGGMLIVNLEWDANRRFFNLLCGFEIDLMILYVNEDYVQAAFWGSVIADICRENEICMIGHKSPKGKGGRNGV